MTLNAKCDDAIGKGSCHSLIDGFFEVVDMLSAGSTANSRCTASR
jgi:hypothetical protein